MAILFVAIFQSNFSHDLSFGADPPHPYERGTPRWGKMRGGRVGCHKQLPLSDPLATPPATEPSPSSWVLATLASFDAKVFSPITSNSPPVPQRIAEYQARVSLGELLSATCCQPKRAKSCFQTSSLLLVGILCEFLRLKQRKGDHAVKTCHARTTQPQIKYLVRLVCWYHQPLILSTFSNCRVYHRCTQL